MDRLCHVGNIVPYVEKYLFVIRCCWKKRKKLIILLLTRLKFYVSTIIIMSSSTISTSSNNISQKECLIDGCKYIVQNAETVSVAFDLNIMKNNKIKIKKNIGGFPFTLSFGDCSLCDGDIWRIMLTKEFDTPIQIKFDTYIYDNKCAKFGVQQTAFNDFSPFKKNYMCYNFGYINLTKNCKFVTSSVKVLCALRNIEIRIPLMKADEYKKHIELTNKET